MCLIDFVEFHGREHLFQAQTVVNLLFHLTIGNIIKMNYNNQEFAKRPSNPKLWGYKTL